MTDTLIDEVNDTGEIPRTDPGQTTRNLTPYLNLPPALRRPDATFELAVIDGGCRTVVPNDEDFRPSAPSTPPGPDPLPPPPPPTPKRSVLYVMPKRRPFAYAGRHRHGWHGTWRRFLADVTAPLVRAW